MPHRQPQQPLLPVKAQGSAREGLGREGLNRERVSREERGRLGGATAGSGGREVQTGRQSGIMQDAWEQGKRQALMEGQGWGQSGWATASPLGHESMGGPSHPTAPPAKPAPAGESGSMLPLPPPPHPPTGEGQGRGKAGGFGEPLGRGGASNAVIEYAAAQLAHRNHGIALPAALPTPVWRGSTHPQPSPSAASNQRPKAALTLPLSPNAARRPAQEPFVPMFPVSKSNGWRVEEEEEEEEEEELSGPAFLRKASQAGAGKKRAPKQQHRPQQAQQGPQHAQQQQAGAGRLQFQGGAEQWHARGRGAAAAPLQFHLPAKVGASLAVLCAV